MKHVRSRAIFYCCFLHFVLGVGLVLLSGCGGGGGSSSTGGSIVFNVTVESEGSTNADGQIDCEDTKIDEIEAKVLGEGDRVIARGGPWKCEDHEGTITGVKAGNNRIVVLDAKHFSGKKIYEGQSDPVTIIAGQTTDAGTIILRPLGSPPSPPTDVIATPGVGRITISWSSVPDARSYNIYWDIQPGVSKDQWKGRVTNWPSTSFTHTGLTDRRMNYFVVTGENFFGEGDESNEVFECPWLVSNIDGIEMSESTSIAVSQLDDRVHIIYRDSGNDHLKYATNASGNWEAVVVRECGYLEDTCLDPSMALDSSDKVHVSYYSYSLGRLKYITNASGPWVTDVVHYGDGTDVGLMPSIAIDSSHKVHISYLALTDDPVVTYLNYATGTFGKWNITEAVDSGPQVGVFSSIGLDSLDDVHVSYGDIANHDLKYVRSAFGDWDDPELVDQTNAGWHTSIAIDSSDNVHITYSAYSKAGPVVLKYATNASGDWEIIEVDGVDEVGWYNAVALDSLNNVHISYYDLDNRDLKYATNASGFWATYTVDTMGDVGKFTSIAIDSDDNVHISYYADDPYQELRYVTKATY